MKIACLVFAIGLLLVIAEMGNAAVPQQVFNQCSGESGSSSLSKDDLKQIAQISKLIVCQTQSGILSKDDIVDLLKNKTDVGVSVSSTAYNKGELMDMARAGALTLIVDGPRIARADLEDIAKAGAQLVVVSNTAGFSKADLLSLAQAKPFLLAVNSNFIKEDLKQLMDNKVQLLVYVGQAGLGSYDVLDITKSHPDLITVRP